MSYKAETYQFVADFIFRQSGMVYSDKEYFRLDSRIIAVIKTFGLANEDELVQKVRQDGVSGQVGKKLLELSTNNETLFYRDSKPFKTLVEELVPRMNLKEINIWSAGCSSGQEPYSIAMALLMHHPHSNFKIFASDISREILMKAQKAVYTKLEVTRGLDPSLLEKYFIKLNDNAWEVKPEVKNKIDFSYLNLIADPFPTSKFDIIFCRNVLIYQNYENRVSIIKKFEKSLTDNGVLFLGSGESIIGMDVGLKMELVSGSMVFRKNVKNVKQVA